MNNANAGHGAGGKPGARGSATPIVLLTCLAMLAFASNSLLTRLAFQTTAIDAATFTCIRVVAGALTLMIILRIQGNRLVHSRSSSLSAFLLFAYAAAFSFAYRNISVGAGALVLFASAQLLMISYGLYKGERASALGVLTAIGGMAAFLMPSASAPPLGAAALMAIAGFAWGGFSLLGRSTGSPVVNTAGSFLLAVPFTLILAWFQREHLVLDWVGAAHALLSGSLASAIGYVIWYWVRSRMSAISAGAVQLSVPVLSALLGVLLLGETVSPKSVIAGLVTLGGVAWVTWSARPAGR
ncbi:DMT family transporter [Massilia niastensis]|uniref:DMT family transporter n=1 Tax=Massilia niastensis TaxID=544911 RepID=UPI0009FFBA04|nr:DMT family transporter [Massilia niastensis]